MPRPSGDWRPLAQRHECLFHAGQALHRQIAQIYGLPGSGTDAQAVAVGQMVDELLAAETKRTAQRRY